MVGLMAGRIGRIGPAQGRLDVAALAQPDARGRVLSAGVIRSMVDSENKAAALAQNQGQFDATQQLKRDSLGQQASQFDQTLGLERDKVATEAISGLRGGLGLGRPLTQTTAPTPAKPLLRTGTSSWGDGTMGTQQSEEEAGTALTQWQGRKNGGVIGNVKKDNGKDKVPVVAREGEYYLNPETVAHIGGGDYKQGLRSLNALVRESTGKEPGPSPVGKSGLRGFANGGFYSKANEELMDGVNAAARQVLPVTQHALNRASEGAQQQFDKGNYAAAAGRVVGGALETAGSIPLDAYEYMRRGVAAAVPALQAFGKGMRGDADADVKPTASRGAGDEYTNSPERQKWLEDIAKRGNTAPDAVAALKASTGNYGQPTNEAEWRQQQRAADVYRTAWQGQSKGGLRNANSDALTLYNAENYARGTGIEAKRQANGTIEFSDSGGRRAPQYLDANGNPTNDWKNTSQYRDAVVRQIGSDNPNLRRQGLAAAMRLAQMDEARKGMSLKEQIEIAKWFQDLEKGSQGISKGKKDALGETFKQLNIPPEQQAVVMQNLGDLTKIAPEDMPGAVAKTLLQLQANDVANQFSIGGLRTNALPEPTGEDEYRWKDMRMWDDDPLTPNIWDTITSSKGDVVTLQDGRRINAAGLKKSIKDLDTLRNLGVK